MSRSIHKYFIGLSLLALLVFSIHPISASAASDKNISIQNDYIALKITGGQNVPQYSFWAVNNNDTKYQVKFNRLFEVVDENDNGVYDKGTDSMVPRSNEALPSFTWDFSDIVDENGIIKFNITSVNGEFMIQFRNYLDSNKAELKFDIIIDNYSFVNDEPNVLLVLGFHLMGDKEPVVLAQNTVKFGSDGYFGSAPSATIVNSSSSNSTSNIPETTIPNAANTLDDNSTSEETTIGVKMSEADEEGNPMAFLAFEHFNGRLEYDPTIGLADDSTNSELLSVPGYPMLGFTLIVLTGVFFLIMKKFKR
ncbi:MAG: hypothetical protein K9W44_11350 [Candidatus Lokiarchaeota archaeon]|nr:hypothetical protein [Candidatus Harpocratesius repetitus]